MKVRLTFILVLLLVGCGATVWMMGSFLSSPANKPVGPPPADVVASAVEFPSTSGSLLHGWFIQGQNKAGAVVLMHGVRASRLSMLDRARFLTRAGFSVLLFDFQAHGESVGDKIAFGHLESRDARAAVDFIRSKLPGEKIGVIGVSMGGAAFLLAEPKLDADAVVLEMVYPTIEQAVSNRMRMQVGGLSTVLTPLLLWQLKPRLGVSSAEIRPIDHVATATLPKLFIAGADDVHTTLDESKELFQAASEPKELWIIPGAQHVDLYPLVKDAYEQRVTSFFVRYLR